jgi:hypothetical protein
MRSLERIWKVLRAFPVAWKCTQLSRAPCRCDLLLANLRRWTKLCIFLVPGMQRQKITLLVGCFLGFCRCSSRFVSCAVACQGTSFGLLPHAADNIFLVQEGGKAWYWSSFDGPCYMLTIHHRVKQQEATS